MNCGEIHQVIEKRLDDHDERLDIHDKDINDLKVSSGIYNTKIENLCEQIKNLVTTLKWAIGMAITIMLALLTIIVELMKRG